MTWPTCLLYQMWTSKGTGSDAHLFPSPSHLVYNLTVSYSYVGHKSTCGRRLHWSPTFPVLFVSVHTHWEDSSSPSVCTWVWTCLHGNIQRRCDYARSFFPCALKYSILTENLRPKDKETIAIKKTDTYFQFPVDRYTMPQEVTQETLGSVMRQRENKVLWERPFMVVSAGRVEQGKVGRFRIG